MSEVYAVNSVPVASSDDEDLESAETFAEEMELLDSPRTEDPAAAVLYFSSINRQLTIVDADISHLSVPGTSLNFFTIACYLNIARVDKSIAIGRLREFSFSPRLPIIHRPSGFGKSADILYSFYAHDGGLNTEAATIFQHTHTRMGGFARIQEAA